MIHTNVDDTELFAVQQDYDLALGKIRKEVKDQKLNFKKSRNTMKNS